MKLAFERIPDLVLCDVMMPGIDGCEVCRRLKADERTSHIPVILLTARSLCDDRIKGLEAGADAYMAKPCDIVELKVRIGNLLEGRRALRERYLHIGTSGAETAVSAEERFLGRVRSIVAERLSDARLDTASLASQLGLSRMQLNRKLQALTGRSTHVFIRRLRLDRAAEMLQGRSGTVTEVAYAVGFNNLSHFARAFRQEHGVRPSEYAAEKAHATAPGHEKTPEGPFPRSTS
jgi:DNA-binding response OmpR family regulator